MRTRPSPVLLLLSAVAAGPTTGPTTAPADDPLTAYRDRFAVADKLDVTAVTVDDQTATDGPAKVAMTCRLRAAGTYTFTFDAYRPGGEPRSVTVAWPAPSTRFAAVRPGGIHGGPPRVGPRANDPIVSADAADPAVVTVRWSYGESRGPAGRHGYTLAKTAVTAAK